MQEEDGVAEVKQAALQRLAVALERRSLCVPLALILDALSPLDVVSSQLALFARPFVVGHPWHDYAVVLADEQGWRDLRRLLDAHDY